MIRLKSVVVIYMQHFLVRLFSKNKPDSGRRLGGRKNKAKQVVTKQIKNLFGTAPRKKGQIITVLYADIRYGKEIYSYDIRATKK